MSLDESATDGRAAAARGESRWHAKETTEVARACEALLARAGPASPSLSVILDGCRIGQQQGSARERFGRGEILLLWPSPSDS